MFSLVIRPLFIAGHIAYYELNVEYITEKFCENKEKPQLQCNGKCHLAKELSVVGTNSSNDQEEGVKIVTAYKSFTPLFHQDIKLDFLSNEGNVTLQNKDSFFYSDCYSFSSEYSLLKPPIV